MLTSMDGCDLDDDDDGVDGVDGVDVVDVVDVDGVDFDVDNDAWLLIVTKPMCDLGSSCGMNWKQLTLDLRLSENHRVLSPLVRNIVMP